MTDATTTMSMLEEHELFTMGWTVRDLGLQDAVTVRLEKASEL